MGPRPTTIPSRLAFALLLLATVLVGTAQAATFGEVLDLDDERVVRVLEDDGDVPDRWVWLDRDTTDDEDEYDGRQTVYIVETTSRISNNDIRVGSGQVSAQTLDDDEELESLSGSLDHYDEDGDGEFDSSDGLYYDVSGEGSGEISDLDIHVAGSRGSDGEDLEGYSGSFAFVDRDGDGEYGDDDDVYLDSDGDDLLTAADVGISGQHEGEVLDGDDEDVVHVLDTSGAAGTFTYLDRDGSGVLDQDEPVYLSQSSSQVEAHDVRLANPPEGSSGGLVESGDEDHEDDLTGLGGELAYFDENGDRIFGPTDTLFYDRSSGSSGRVSTLDVVLSGPDAGTLAGSNHHQAGNALTSLSIDAAFDDRDGDETYSRDDEVYLDVDGDGFVTGVDLQLTSEIGRFVRASDSDATARTSTSNAPDRLVVSDDDGDGRPDEDEALYLHTESDRVGVGAVRLGYPPTGGLGSQVRIDDRDFGAGASELSGDLAFLDTQDEGAFGEDDTLFYDLSGSGSDVVSANDVVLSGSSAGGIVAPGGSDISRSLSSYGGAFAFLDADADGDYNLGDGLVVDTDDDGFLTAADVLLRGADVLEPAQPSGDADEEPADADSGTDAPKRAVRVGEAFDAPAGHELRVSDGLPARTTALGLTFAQACDGCSVHVAAHEEPPNQTTAMPSGWQALEYRTLEVRGSDGDPVADAVQAGSLALEIPSQRLPADATPAHLALLRHTDGWEPLPTRTRGAPDADPIPLNSTLPGFSVLALAADEDPPNLTDPRPTGSTTSKTPTIGAAWSDNRAVDQASLTLRFDDTTQTNETGHLTTSTGGFSFVPEKPLEGGEHRVEVSIHDGSGWTANHTWRFRVGDAECPTLPAIENRTPAPNATRVPPGEKIEVTVEEGSCRISSAWIHVDGDRIPAAYGTARLTGMLPTSIEPNETVTIEARLVDEGGNTVRQAWAITTGAAEGSGASEDTAETPGLGPVLTVGAVSLVALSVRRRSHLV